MFEVGKQYDFTMLEWGENGPGPVESFKRTVSEVNGSLVKFVTSPMTVSIGGVSETYPATEEIVNVASLYFVSARPSKA